MVESMTATAERIADYEMIYGKEEVESFLDAVLSDSRTYRSFHHTT